MCATSQEMTATAARQQQQQQLRQQYQGNNNRVYVRGQAIGQTVRHGALCAKRATTITSETATATGTARATATATTTSAKRQPRDNGQATGASQVNGQ